MNDDERFSIEIRELENKIEALEEAYEQGNQSSTSLNGYESSSQILKRINIIQNLVDQIEIEIDKLEMKISAIEHMDFRLRTGGQ